jgi:hypothetical protein
MTELKTATHGFGKFPKRWRDDRGKVTVMGEPIDGYVMCRRPGGFPFVLRVAQILNAEKHPVHGPFECLETQPAPRSRAHVEQQSDRSAE